MESEKKSSSISNFGAWGMNVVSSVGIIMANKHLMSNNGYAFTFGKISLSLSRSAPPDLWSFLSYTATTLTGFHFAVTALVGLVSNASGYSAPKHVPLWELLWFSAIANISITGMNLSLMLNSVGFYQVSASSPLNYFFFFSDAHFIILYVQQISKLSMIPVVCIMEWILHGKHYSREVKTAVMVVVIGVGVCTVTDVKVNLKGFVCACLAVVSSSLQQIVSVFQCFYFNLLNWSNTRLLLGVTCIDVES